MAKRKASADGSEKRVPKVRIARPTARPIQLRYTCPDEQREIRISTGTTDEDEAQQQKEKLEAKLLLGLDAKPKKKAVRGPRMPWEDFRELYSQLQLSTLRGRSIESAESRLDIAERILKPKTLADFAHREALQTLQTRLLAGDEGRIREGEKKPRPRSAHTVNSYMAVYKAAISWAHYQGWIESKPAVRKVKASKLKTMKGRPITTEEFERMLDATVLIVGEAAAASWKHVLRGLWTSALRLDELMHVSWDDAAAIQPVWKRGRHPVLRIPHEMQKNATEEEIPLLPWFDQLLQKTPKANRAGWVFNPLSMNGMFNRPARVNRASAEWVGKIISRIGEKAGVVVEPGDESRVKPAKFASAHDLRRSCAERLLDAGVPPIAIARVLRHASWETTRRHYAPGDVQKDALLLRRALL